MVSRGQLGWWLLAGVLALVPLACKKATTTELSAKNADTVIEDEAYILPPLSTFVPMPDEITSDLKAKCAAEGLELGALNKSSGDGRTSIWAVLHGTGTDDPRPTVMKAYTILGHNFADLARVVVSCQDASGTTYWVSTGSHLDEFLNIDLSSKEKPLTEDAFWSDLSNDVVVKAPEAAPKAEPTVVVGQH